MKVLSKKKKKISRASNAMHSFTSPVVVRDDVPVAVADEVSVDVSVAVRVDVCVEVRVDDCVDVWDVVYVAVAVVVRVVVADLLGVLVREVVASSRVKRHQAKGSATTQRPSALHYCSNSTDGPLRIAEQSCNDTRPAQLTFLFPVRNNRNFVRSSCLKTGMVGCRKDRGRVVRGC